MTVENDVVLIYLQEKPLSYARIEAIEPDHKRGWFHVKLLLLQIPLQVVTWILRDIYLNGETFTMDGNPMRLEKVICPPEDRIFREKPSETSVTKNGNVISFADMKKNQPSNPLSK
jgi:hypothetical protein